MTLFAIPRSWAWTTLGEIAEVVGGVTKDSKKQSDPSLPAVPYLRVANVQRGYLDLANVATIRVPESTLEKLRLMPGDVLLNEGGDRDKLGRGWVWQGQVPNCIHQNHVFRARIIDNVLHPKLLALFANECGRDWFERQASQTVNLASISLTKIKQLPVPVPPPAEQHRIVAALDDHLSRLDAAIGLTGAAKHRADRLTARYADYLLGLTPARTPALREVLRDPLVNGRSVPTEVGGFPVLRLTALRNGRLDLTERKGGRWTRDEAARFLIKKGDFFISRGNGSLDLVGRGALLDEEPDEVAFPDTMIRLRADEQILSRRFLRVVWNSRVVRDQIERRARTTAGIYKVNQQILESITIPIPDLTAQERLATEVERTLSIMAASGAAVESSLARAENLRRSVLRQAFAGRLVPHDPGDGPASVLLERIRRERAARPKPQRRRRAASEPQEEALL